MPYCCCVVGVVGDSASSSGFFNFGDADGDCGTKADRGNLVINTSVASLKTAIADALV